METKRVFNFDLQVNKLNAVFKNKINTEITADKAYNAVFSIAQNAGGASFEIIALEKDFVKFGDGIVSALKKAGVEYSVLLISVTDLNFTKPQKIFGLKSSEVIILGGKDLISYALFYASYQTENIHAVLTEPYVEGLLGNTVTVPDGGFVKVITVSKLKTLILDKSIINKADANSISYAYIKCISKLVALIDYKLALLIGSKVLNKEYYDRSRLAVTLVSNINSFSNYVEVLAYASLLNAEVLHSSNVLLDGGQRHVAHAIELQLPAEDKGNVAYVAFDRVVKLYHAFFTNDLTDVVSVANYNGDISLISKISGKDVSYFYDKLKIPSAKRKDMLSKLISLTRNGFLKETTVALTSLADIKSNYCKFKKQKQNVINFKYAHLKNGVELASYLSSETTVLTLLRDFGVLNLLK